MTGHKRALGWGTFFAVVLTFGLWLLALPFYQKRCVICGNLPSGSKVQKKEPLLAASAEKPGRSRIKILLAIVGVLVVLGWIIGAIQEGRKKSPEQRAGTAEQLPPFEVTGQHVTNLALLVSKDTSNDQLKALVLALKKARRENGLGRLIPPTTPGGSRGPYGIVVVYIYSEPDWATADALQRCVTASANTSLYTECGRHVRAYYFYGAEPENEEGSVGYAEGKQVFTRPYQKLF